MKIILSQRVDSESEYSGDELFKVYHYPRRYRKQIHPGDVFIYYQGNRYDKTQRYYFGTGVIGNIRSEDDDNYYAELLDTIRFERIVPIYLPDKGYIEQLGYETVRNSINPPWQSSIRPLSEQAYQYIIEHAGTSMTRDYLDKKLKVSIQDYYIQGDERAVLRIAQWAKKLAELYKLKE